MVSSVLKIISDLAIKYRVSKIVLFGSAQHLEHEPHDFDLGVEGLRSELFFNFYGDLLFLLGKPVDLIDLSEESELSKIISKESIPIYECT